MSFNPKDGHAEDLTRSLQKLSRSADQACNSFLAVIEAMNRIPGVYLDEDSIPYTRTGYLPRLTKIAEAIKPQYAPSYFILDPETGEAQWLSNNLPPFPEMGDSPLTLAQFVDIHRRSMNARWATTSISSLPVTTTAK